MVRRLRLVVSRSTQKLRSSSDGTTLLVVATALSLLVVALPMPLAAATGGPRVAILGADDPSLSANVLETLRATGRFSAIDVFQSDQVTPTLDQLLSYDAILAWTNSFAADSTALGNRLADYSDAGGGVVLATFSFSSPWNIAGRITTPSYRVLTVAEGFLSGQRMQLAPDIPEHPLLEGVSSFDGGASSFHSASSVSTGATLVAHWSGDGRPLVAFREAPVGNGLIVGLNFFPPSSVVRDDLWQADTDGDTLLANALTEAAGKPVPSSKAQCNQGGWQDFVDDSGEPFRNQGQCVRYVTHASA